MNEIGKIDTSALLTQMRAMAAAAQGQTAPVNSNPVGSGFGELLARSINSVNELQQQSSHMSEAFLRGDSSVSLAEVMIAKQKSSVAFEATVQVRNKLISAYKEIMAMQV
jgi:flagellar hook-basal body complex protein FliE